MIFYLVSSYCLSFELWVFCSATATEVTNSERSTQEDPGDPHAHTVQDGPESKLYDASAEEADVKQSDQEQKHKMVQSQEEENCTDAVQHHQEHEAAADQRECETCTDSSEPEDTEQVETFFSTMSHRYENATQEGHIL